MKLLPTIKLAAMFLALGCHGHAQDDVRPPESPVIVVEKALRDRNIERIREICADVNLQGYLVSALSSEPQSPWRDEVLLALIESPWHGDRQPNKPAPPGSPPMSSVWLAIRLLAPCLPEESLRLNDDNTQRKLTTFEERKRLVAKFREARMRRGAGIEGGHDGRDNGDAPTGQRAPTGKEVTFLPGGEEPGGYPARGDNVETDGGRSRIFAGVIALFILGAVVIFWRQWRGKSRS